MTRTPIWSVIWVNGSANTGCPPLVRAAFAANDVIDLARPETVR